MKRYFAIRLLLLSALSLSVSFAADRTITLLVPGMNCPSCPYRVEQSLPTVEGVRTAEADLGIGTAQVTFDDAIASVDVILGSTAASGYATTVVVAGEGS